MAVIIQNCKRDWFLHRFPQQLMYFVDGSPQAKMVRKISTGQIRMAEGLKESTNYHLILGKKTNHCFIKTQRQHYCI